ncbi:SH3 domain-containing protein [Streptomyces sp. NA04227]|uniref:SH3 domain-containing protein n=1 Tax=Streptomyces sp. NA04227 TaxID=2742136 RepID=UPI0015927813|nr:SH3 domain-containing protein [Streptomyces sp. NA04227]QKW08118.1 SH3 domain-containing protein [Streptomyces sp. NA04227]
MNPVAELAARSARIFAAGSLAAATAVGAAGIGTSAQAADPGYGSQTLAAPARPYVTVTTRAGLNIRQYPSTDSSVKGVLKYGTKVGVLCKVRAQNIEGNSIWYQLRDKRHVWISGRYVHVTGYVQYCKDVYPSSRSALPGADG